MAKFQAILDTLERRIKNGDYRVRQFPSFADLADELRVNHRTVSKALSELVDRGALVRLPTGRVTFRQDEKPAQLHLGMLAPAYPSTVVGAWHRAFERLATARGWQIKLIGYHHWDDPTISEALNGLDGVVLVPLSDMPPTAIKQIKQSGRPVVVLEQDVSAEAIPCLRFVSPATIYRLLSALDLSRFTHVHCLNCQPISGVVRNRIEHWQLWNQAHGAGGRLIDEPAPLFDSSIVKAHAVMRRELKNSDWRGAGLFCTAGGAAIGAIRAIIDAGLTAGVDVGVCAADDDGGRAPYLSPSLTCPQHPAWDPYLQVCLDWFGRGGREWLGPLLVQPAEVEIFQGESTQAWRKTKMNQAKANSRRKTKHILPA